MTIDILDLAKRDLVEGFRFYEDKEAGLGQYFLTNLYADIESLRVTGGVHRQPFGNYHRALSKRFPSQSITPVKMNVCDLPRFSIADGNPPGSDGA